MAEPSRALRDAVINFQRSELRNRYEIENVRRFEEFEPVSDESIHLLRDYFLEHVYAPPEDRAKLDEAFDHLGRLLASPKRLTPLMGTVLRSMWRLGRQLPAAVSAGRSTFDAYLETRRLENYMMKQAVESRLTLAQTRDRIRMLTLITSIPRKHVLRLIRDMINLFHSLTRISLLRTSEAIMEHVYEIMCDRPNVYPESERAGLALGIQVLQGGLALFENMDQELFPHIIRGIELVELDWYEAVCAEVGAAKR